MGKKRRREVKGENYKREAEERIKLLTVERIFHGMMASEYSIYDKLRHLRYVP